MPRSRWLDRELESVVVAYEGPRFAEAFKRLHPDEDAQDR
jgi:hypothetical protein